MIRRDAPVTVELLHKTYGLDRRAGVLVNIHNPADMIRLQDLEATLMKLAAGASPAAQLDYVGIANKLDEVLGRPQGSGSKDLLTMINATGPATNTTTRIVRRKDLGRSR